MEKKIGLLSILYRKGWGCEHESPACPEKICKPGAEDKKVVYYFLAKQQSFLFWTNYELCQNPVNFVSKQTTINLKTILTKVAFAERFE